MRSLLAALFVFMVLHVACGRTTFDTPGFREPSAGAGGGSGSEPQGPSASAGGGWAGTNEPGSAAGSLPSLNPNTGGQGPLPAGGSATAGAFVTGGGAAGNPTSRPSSVASSVARNTGGQAGAWTNTGGWQLTSTNTMGGSGGTSRSTATGGTASSGGACAEVTPCGGDVVGTWEVKSQCLTFDGQADISYLGLTCVPNLAANKGSMKVTGTLTLGSDGKFKDATTTTGSETWQMDKSCLILSGTKVSCDSIGTVFEGVLEMYGYGRFTCKDAASGGGCTCAATLNTDAPNGRPGGMGILHNDAYTKGKYKTDGKKLTLEDTLSYSYCVRGNEMTLSPIPVENSGTPYKGTIVLTRLAVPTGGTGGATATGGKTASGAAGRTAN